MATSSSMMNKSLSLTFGVELEFRTGRPRLGSCCSGPLAKAPIPPPTPHGRLSSSCYAAPKWGCARSCQVTFTRATSPPTITVVVRQPTHITLSGSGDGGGGADYCDYDYWQVADDVSVRLGRSIATVELQTPVVTATTTTTTTTNTAGFYLGTAGNSDLRG
jgi:hypothetical protein